MADPKITIKVEGSGLPQGGSDGQVLTMQDGKAVWGDAPRELPEGTALYQQLVTDADGVAKWEDRLAYESITEYLMEPTNVVMDHETTLPNGEPAVAGNGPEIGSVDLVDVYVKWDGIEYYFNTSMNLGGSGSGAAFGVGVEAENGFLIVAGNAPFPIEIIAPYGDIGDVHNVAIYKRENKTVKPIDPKYIPKEAIATIKNSSYNYYTIVEGEGASREQICNAIKRGQPAFLRCNAWNGLLSYTHQIESNGTNFPNGTVVAFFSGIVRSGLNGIELQYRTFGMIIADENGNIPNGDFIAWDDSRNILTGFFPTGYSGVMSYSNDQDGEVFGVNWENVPNYLPTTVPVIKSAQVGQTVVVKAVDENGKPTEWEAKNATNEIIVEWDVDVMDSTGMPAPSCNVSYEEFVAGVKSGKKVVGVVYSGGEVAMRGYAVAIDNMLNDGEEGWVISFGDSITLRISAVYKPDGTILHYA